MCWWTSKWLQISKNLHTKICIARRADRFTYCSNDDLWSNAQDQRAAGLNAYPRFNWDQVQQYISAWWWYIYTHPVRGYSEVQHLQIHSTHMCFLSSLELFSCSQLLSRFLRTKPCKGVCKSQFTDHKSAHKKLQLVRCKQIRVNQIPDKTGVNSDPAPVFIKCWYPIWVPLVIRGERACQGFDRGQLHTSREHTYFRPLHSARIFW